MLAKQLQGFDNQLFYYQYQQHFMKKIFFLAVVLFAFSCTNPEDRATGDPNNENYNSEERKVLNTPEGFGDQETRDRVDTTDLLIDSANDRQ